MTIISLELTLSPAVLMNSHNIRTNALIVAIRNITTLAPFISSFPTTFSPVNLALLLMRNVDEVPNAHPMSPNAVANPLRSFCVWHLMASVISSCVKDTLVSVCISSVSFCDIDRGSRPNNTR